MSNQSQVKNSSPAVDPVVTENINAALDQLNLDDIDDSSSAPQPLQLSHPPHPLPPHPHALSMFPHPSLMGFMPPYSQMMHIPPPHGAFSPAPPAQDPGFAWSQDRTSLRRQTFHSISDTFPESGDTNTTTTRTQSISDGSILETPTPAAATAAAAPAPVPAPAPHPYKIAYPYRGPPLQLSAQQPPHSPFPGAYGFSPLIHHPHSPIPPPPPPPPFTPPNDAMRDEKSTPPPWMYTNHPFVPQPIHQIPSHLLKNTQKKEKSFTIKLKSKKYTSSRKLEDSSFYANATLSQFIGNIYSLCKDQHGCRFLQKQLEELGEDAATAILKEIKPHIVELMTDSFGNYLIQKLLEVAVLSQRIEISQIAVPHVLEMALNPHGTRALQKLVECVQTDQEAEIIVDALEPFTIQLCKDLNGNHVIQKCLQQLKPIHFQFIFDAVCSHSVEIATHRHGCCVLQRCLDHGTDTQCQELCDTLLQNVDKLTLDPFGNYVVQYIVAKEAESSNYNYTYKIVSLLKPKLKELSLHKFGSNVIEKCLKTPVVSESIILELLKNGGEDEIQILLNDSYGNYVLQTALDSAQKSNALLHKQLKNMITPLLVGPIRNTPHGRRLMNKLQME